MTAASTDLYATALRATGQPGAADAWFARYEGGGRRSLGGALRRWCGTADATDRAMLDLATGAVLDAGCGPGRLVAELTRQGRQAAGIDTSRAAVLLARRAGATALRRSVFDPLPGEGRWDTLLLADGNIGIGGDPVGLLSRCRQLVDPAGVVLVELERPGSGLRTNRIRLEHDRGAGSWFDWAHVAVDAVEGPAAAAGLGVRETWERDGRWFAGLVRGSAPTGGGTPLPAAA